MKIEKSGKKVKAHIRYKNKEEKIVPGTTTITGILNKPALVYWANNLGLEGINVRDYVDDKSDIGTLDHEMMFVDLKNVMALLRPEGEILLEQVDENHVPLRIKGYYTSIQLEIAQIGFKKYLEWKKQHTIVPIILEKGLVSEKYQYGGTIDNYSLIDNVPTLIDYKTCKALYLEHFIQFSAYNQILREHGHKVKNNAILRIGRGEVEGFDYYKIPDEELSLCWKIFEHCLQIYSLKKQLKK